MWAKVLDKIGEQGLIYCTAALSREAQDQIVPGVTGWDYLPDRPYTDDAERTAAMVQNALICAVNHPRSRGSVPSVAFIKEGPYAVPICGP